MSRRRRAAAASSGHAHGAPTRPGARLGPLGPIVAGDARAPGCTYTRALAHLVVLFSVLLLVGGHAHGRPGAMLRGSWAAAVLATLALGGLEALFYRVTRRVAWRAGRRLEATA